MDAKRILVLDDEQDVLDVYRSLLVPKVAPTIVTSRKLNAAPAAPDLPPIELTCATSGSEAMLKVSKALSEGNPFIGGFFDVRLGPGMDGVETIRQIKYMDPNIFCVIVTAYQDRNIGDITKIFGAEYSDRWDYLSKPFSSGEIIQKAANIIANWNRKNREKAILKELESKQQQEELIRELVDDIFGKIRDEGNKALDRQDMETLKNALNKIMGFTHEADHILHDILALVQRDSLSLQSNEKMAQKK